MYRSFDQLEFTDLCFRNHPTVSSIKQLETLETSLSIRNISFVVDVIRIVVSIQSLRLRAQEVTKLDETERVLTDLASASPDRFP
jgi:hypothetical protein